MAYCWIAIVAVLVPLVSAQEFSLASYYDSHMVLQSGTGNKVWGFGTKPDDVILEKAQTRAILQRKVGVQVSADIWEVVLDAVEAGGPYTITAVGSANTVKLEDVYFGEVWFCSGQSNMYMHMKEIFNGADEIEASLSYDKIRYTMTEPHYIDTPQEDVKKPPTDWSPPAKGSLGEMSAVCFLYGRILYDYLKVPIGLISSSYGGTTVETWSDPEAIAQCDNKTVSEPEWDIHWNYLYNAMVHPYTRLSIRGAIWYQGEANYKFLPSTYACRFPAMINGWRKIWNERTAGHTDADFPFGLVQLATNNPDTMMPWPELRWHQTADKGVVPNENMERTFMAVTMDLPDPDAPLGPIHPRDKLTVATRLAWTGLHDVYGMNNVDTQGPVVQEFAFNNPVLTLTYDREILVKSDDTFLYCCTAYEECSNDMSTWHRALMTSHDDKNVLLDVGECDGAQPPTLTYGWLTNPCEYKNCSVYAAHGVNLPAPPFIWRFD